MNRRPIYYYLHHEDLFAFILLFIIFVLSMGVLAWLFSTSIAQAQPGPQWANESPQVREWFESLTAPDTGISCCGEADGFPVKDWKTDGANYFDVTLMDGRVFRVPAEKRQWREGNPTGRDILFVGVDGRTIYCFVVGAGI